MIRKLIFLLFLCLTSFTAQATPATDYAMAQKCYHEWKGAGLKEAAGLQNCIDSFEKLASKNEKSEWGIKANFSAGKLYQEKYDLGKDIEDAKKSIHAFNQVLRNDSSHRMADDALYQIATLREEATGEKDRARFALESLIQKYPNGDMVVASQKRLGALAGTAVVVQTEKKEEEEPKPEPEPEPESEPEPTPVPAAAPTVTKTQLLRVEPWTAGDYAKMVLQFNRIPSYHTTVLPEDPVHQKPARLVLDLQETSMRPGLANQHPLANPGLLKNVRMDQKEKTVRVVMDASVIGRQEILTVGDQLIVNIYQQEAKSEGGNKKEPALPGNVQEKDLGGSQVQGSRTPGSQTHGSQTLPANSSIRRVVIDPGHGGKDPGAIGKKGTREKDVTLQIARKIAWKLKKDLGLEVYLTRNKDGYLSLEERSAFAEKKKADLFISVHANAADSHDLKGVQTFYLNNASSRAAERLADRENKVTGGKLNDVQKILTTMLQNANTEESRDLAGFVHKDLIRSLQSKYPRVEDLEVQTALFYVLVGTKIPAVLVETSFLTNPQEERRLRDSDYQWNIASGISKGIKKFIVHQAKYASTL